MTNQPLSILDLRDIVESAPVGVWPLSPGVWVLLGVLFLALAVLAWQLGNRHRDHAYRRTALRELEELRQIFGIPPDRPRSPREGTRPTEETPRGDTRTAEDRPCVVGRVSPPGVSQPVQGGSDPHLVPAASVLLRATEILKRTALAGFPRSEVARLSGPDWVNWLNATGHGAKFTGPAAHLLSDAAYEAAPPDPGEVGRLIELAGQWIRRHRSAAPRRGGSPPSVGK